jgi:hypothetical protein
MIWAVASDMAVLPLPFHARPGIRQRLATGKSGLISSSCKNLNAAGWMLGMIPE